MVQQALCAVPSSSGLQFAIPQMEGCQSMSELISRRTWIGINASGVLGIGLGASDADDSTTVRDIIDCHTHFYDPTRPEGVPWPSEGTSLYRTVLPKHLRALKQFRPVTGIVIIEASPRLEDNLWLLNLAKDDPFIVGVVGNLTPGRPDFERHVKRFAANPLFRGIRVSSNLVTELLTKNHVRELNHLVDHDLALDVNGGPDTPAIVARLASQLPALRIVQNHIGNVPITSDLPPGDWQVGIRAEAMHPNVYCKISALTQGAARNGQEAPTDLEFYRPYIDVVWNAFGDDRVMYGSDWPVSERASDYYTLQRIVMEYAFEKGASATAKFCSLNAKQVYKWVERSGRR